MESFLIAARAVHYASTISLAGVFAFFCFVVGPVVSPALCRRLSLVAWASLAWRCCPAAHGCCLFRHR